MKIKKKSPSFTIYTEKSPSFTIYTEKSPANNYDLLFHLSDYDHNIAVGNNSSMRIAVGNYSSMRIAVGNYSYMRIPVWFTDLIYFDKKNESTIRRFSMYICTGVTDVFLTLRDMSRPTRKPTLWTLHEVSTRISRSMPRRLTRTYTFRLLWIFCFRNHYSIPLSPLYGVCRPGSFCADCTVWSGSIYYAEVILFVLSRNGSFVFVTVMSLSLWEICLYHW